MTDFDPSENLTDLYFLHELAKLFSSSIDLEEACSLRLASGRYAR
jgi:hypothetical protein